MGWFNSLDSSGSTIGSRKSATSRGIRNNLESSICSAKGGIQTGKDLHGRVEPRKPSVRESLAFADENEQAITAGEQQLQFGQFETKELCTQFRKNSDCSILKRDAFTTAAESLNLDIEGFDEKDTFKGKLFRKISSGEGLDIKIALEPLLMLSILLGKGTSEEKAIELFEAFDQQGDGKLGRPQIYSMFRSLTLAGIAKLLDCGVGSNDEGLTTQEKIETYRKNLQDNIVTGLDKIVHDVIGSETQEITQEIFVENLSKPQNARILNSTGFRTYIIQSAYSQNQMLEAIAEEENEKASILEDY